jgi:hypothetical protein
MLRPAFPGFCPDACALRRCARVLLGNMEPGAVGGARDRHRFRAGQPFAVGRRWHGARSAFPGAAACAGQAGALRARRAVRRGGGHPQGLAHLRALVRDRAELRQRQAAADPGGFRPRLRHPRAGYRDHLQMLRLLRAGGRGRVALRRSRYRHRLGPRRAARRSCRTRTRRRGPSPGSTARSPTRRRRHEASGDGRRGVHRLGGGAAGDRAGPRGGECRCADLCGLPRQRGERGGQPRLRLRARRYPRPRAMDRISRARARRDHASGRRKPCGPVDRRAGDLHRHQRDRDLHAAGGRARLLDQAGKPEGFRFHHISTDEVYGTLGETGLFTETRPMRPTAPIRRPRPPPTTWCGPGTRPTACRWC